MIMPKVSHALEIPLPPVVNTGLTQEAANSISNAAGAVQAPSPMVVTVGADVPSTLKGILDSVKEYAKSSLTGAIATYLVNLTTFAADEAAREAAVRLVNSGPGGTPLVDQHPWDSYLKDVGAASAGEALGLLNDEITGPGKVLQNFNLCAPGNANVLLSFKFGIKSVFQKQTPKCKVNEVVSNWKGFIADVSTQVGGGQARNQHILTQLADAFDPNTNEFSVGVSLTSNILNNSQEKATLKVEQRLSQNGFQDVTDFISGQVKTPASMIVNDYQQKFNKQGETRNQLSTALLSNTDVLLQIGLHAGSVFTNTLLSKLTEKIYNGWFDVNPALQNTNPFDPSSFAQNNSDVATARLRSIFTATPLEITNYSILSDFSSCPQSNRGIYNCVADSSLISAIARASSGVAVTVQEAMDQGLLKPDWPLIPSSDHARNQDPFCYTYGYCYANLVKLRKARVVSVGWEFAADSEFNSSTNPTTLRKVVAGFNDCDASGQPDTNHPWCKLIDPTWVLKYPQTQCRAAVNGQLLTSGAADERQTECVDMPSCIAEDENGNCTGGYGYCVKEKNAWQFRGQSCPAQFASCITVKNSEKTVSYLRNTTDPGPCTEDNAGCQWYATQKTKQTDGSFKFPATNVLADDVATDTYKNRTYFTSSVEACQAENGGCKELVVRDATLSLNMLVNPNLEDDTDNNAKPDGWIFSAPSSSTLDTASAFSRSGSKAVKTGTGIVYEPGVEFSQGRFYTMSFYARQTVAGGSDIGDMFIGFSADDGSGINLGGTSIMAGANSACVLKDGNNDGKMDAVDVTGKPTGTVYERFSCTFTSPIQANSAARLFAFVDLMPGNAWIDDVQVEQGPKVTNFHSGYSSTTLAKEVVKVPPSYLGCTGASTDPAECAKYAKVCSENDNGCSAYTPANGDPVVTGVVDLGLPLPIVDGQDECPAACVGYDTYRQEGFDMAKNSGSRFEPDGVFPLYLIPSTAKTCRDQDVGCDEFTNLSDESKSYFTYVRACVTPAQAEANTGSDNSATFYTWEGSDNSGYQLKTWDLLQSNLGLSTYTYQNSLGIDTAPGNAPCEHGVATPNGMTCADAVDSNGDQKYDWDTASCDEHSDIFSNSDCREFYDANGVIHYRLWSNTVTVDAACSTYRKTDVVGADLTEKQATCTSSGGFFDVQAGTCRYYGLATGSKTCSAAANGCRSYTGGRSRNSFVAYQDLVEDGNLTKWTSAVPASLVYSNESLATGGHSISTSAPFATLSSSLTGKLPASRTYTLSFLAKGTGTLQAGFDYQAAVASPTIDLAFGSVTVSQGWQQYSLGPLDMSSVSAIFGNGTALAFVPAGNVFVDNIILRAGQDNITLIKNSWSTPAACDLTPTGAPAPQYYLGCQQYSTQTGTKVNVKSFSKLCSADKVGCASFFMTEESASPHAEVHNATCGTIGGAIATVSTACHYGVNATAYDITTPLLCTIGVGSNSCPFNLNWYVAPANLPAHLKYAPSTVITPADKDVFLVVTDDKKCASDAAGCTEYGKPTYNQARTATTGATSKFLKNNPAKYVASGADKSILCSQNALYCSAWTGTGGTQYYFKDPINQTCEYKTNVSVGTVSYSGWFKTGTSELCYNTPNYVIGGNMSGIWKNGDANYAGWVGTCSTQYNSCSEYQDPLAIKTNEIYGNSDGTPYFTLSTSLGSSRSSVTGTDCNGKVSLKGGCALFNDTSVSRKTANASATEMASRHADKLFNTEPYSLVDPIDCDSNATVIHTPSSGDVDLCAKRCAYREGSVKDLTKPDSNTPIYGSSCYTSEDCAPVDSEYGERVKATGCDAATAALRLKDDANTVLAVNRNRECSEWLSCANAQTVWDDASSSYKTICDQVALCTEYSAQGSSSFCSKWNFDAPKVVLTNDRYTSRDVSWYGSEYSGMSIPNLFSVEALEQANVAPKFTCDLSKLQDGGSDNVDLAYFNANNGKWCSLDAECGTGAKFVGTCSGPQGNDVRLILNAGTCTQAYGQACAVGTCANTGAACARQDQCGTTGGACVVGQCYAPSLIVQSCFSDSDCGGGGKVCLGSVCASKGNVVVTDTPASGQSLYKPTEVNKGCGTTNKFVKSINLKDGTCVNEKCLLAPDGNAFAFGTTEGKSCKAYPETTSPFSSEVVTNWFDTLEQKVLVADVPTYDDIPYQKRYGFEQANTCAPGQDCVCSYKKVTYSQVTGARYFGKTTAINGRGICSSGPYVNKSCDTYLDCSNTTALGECSKPTREDILLGMDGYCLERDTSINVNGDRNQSACINWLPVDQLAGSSDLYGKSTEAGYFKDTWACAETDMYAQLAPSQVQATATSGWNGLTTIACAVSNNGIMSAEKSFDATTVSSCLKNATCPAGYWALIGQPHWIDRGNNGHIADACNVGNNDCPYECIPIGSFVGTQSCDITGSFTTSQAVPISTARESTKPNNRIVGMDPGTDKVDTGLSNFDKLAKALSLCRTPAVLWDDSMPTLLHTISTPPDLSKYYNLTFTQKNPDPDGYEIIDAVRFPACKQVVKVSDGNIFAGAAWTDRMLNPTSGFAIDSSEGSVRYTLDTAKQPYGLILDDATTRKAPLSPYAVASCQNKQTGSLISTPLGTAPFNVCYPSGRWMPYSSVPATDPVAPEARSFVGFDINTNGNGYAGQWLPKGTYSNAVTNITQLFANLNIGVTGSWRKWTSWVPSGSVSGANLKYETVSPPTAALDVRATEGNPPKIWAIDPATCNGSECEEGPLNAITVNDQNTGNVSSSDFLRASVKFYAAADKNQLPLRRVIMDWGDGNESGSAADDNFYKNHRGLEPNSTVSKCDGTSGEWGLTAESCDPNYITYSHIYTCSSSTLLSTHDCTDTNNDGKFDNAPCIKEPRTIGASCVYQPRVHTRDNWGWCTGVCTLGTDGKSGCYAGNTYSVNSANDVIDSECSYGIYPDQNSTNDPWVYYNGQIVVKP